MARLGASANDLAPISVILLDFKFKVFIEKRAIQLSPEKIKSKVEKLNKTIEDWQKISDGLGDVVKTMKTACVGVSAVLTVKNEN